MRMNHFFKTLSVQYTVYLAHRQVVRSAFHSDERLAGYGVINLLDHLVSED